jgi:aspartyl-tRNA(Asn)/glutamyl-tRNA(Gln) amidotransferase subunit B
MEEGSMRCDANISLRPFGQEEFGTKAEIKNLNSMSFVKRGLAYEEKRQARVLLSGGVIQQETRRFDDVNNKTLLMRVKEGSSDYRFFPEPDVPRFEISDEQVQAARESLPELPKERRTRYVEELDLPEYDAMVLTLTREMSDFFEGTLANGADAKQASNWLMGDVSAYLNSEKLELADTKLTPENLAGMINLITDGTISSKIAKKVFRELIENGGDAKKVVEAKGLVQLSDPAQLLPMINEVLDNNAQSVEDFKNGKDRAVGFLVGQIMKASRGKANPAVVNKLLQEELAKR